MIKGEELNINKPRLFLIVLLVGLVVFTSCGGNAPENKPDEDISLNVSIETQLLNTISKLENETAEPIEMDDINWIKYVSTSTGQVHLMGYSIGSGDKTKVSWFFPPNVDTNESDSKTCIGEKVGAETKGQDFYDAWSHLGGIPYIINNTGTDLVQRLRFGADDTEIKMSIFESDDSMGALKSKDVADGFSIDQFGTEGTWAVFDSDGNYKWSGTLDWSDPIWDEYFQDEDGTPWSLEKINSLQECYTECWRKGYFGE